MRPHSRALRSSRHGFTLVELLVAVGLTMLIMLMFTQIFQITTASMSTQKGIAENDQKARLAAILLRGDLQNRTMQTVWPFAPSEPDPSTGPEAFVNRQGYFYISENDPDRDDDDILQFTVRNPEEGYFGKALTLNTDLFGNPNQPDFDDGSGSADSTGFSPAAEVSYFVRGNTLYRRVLLLRQPSSHTPPFPEEPHDGPDGAPPTGNPFVTASYPRSFWADFDYSAHFSSTGGPEFHGIDWLTNSGFTSLGIPWYRFGHNNTSGMPREFVPNPIPTQPPIYFGRHTHEETSDTRFRHPSNVNDGTTTWPDPIAGTTDIRGGTVGTGNPGGIEFQNPTTTTWERYNGPRRGEDILLTNVHSFDIKVWDSTVDRDRDGDGAPDSTTVPPGSPPEVIASVLGDFVDIGHSLPTGFYRAAANANTGYGPRPGSNNVFDTWHPSTSLATTGTGFAPYRPTHPISGEHIHLTAIKLTIEYEDVSTGQIRELVIDQSLVGVLQP